MDKLDFKKIDKSLYLPPTSPALITVPPMTFVMVDGTGDPNTPGGAYERAVGMLYTLSYTIKMSPKKAQAPVGYFDYVVPPLEGLWWYRDGGAFRFGEKEHFCWTAMLRQPDFVTADVFEWARGEAARKNPDLDLSALRLAVFDEGLCVQCMHIGPYDAEPRTVEKMALFMKDNNLEEDFSPTRHHHEIYLSDPRKSDPVKMKTVIRHPAKHVF